MIDDIIFEASEFILEIPFAVAGGIIAAYSLDGSNYAIAAAISAQTSLVFIT